jgi:hypothetical protein
VLAGSAARDRDEAGLGNAQQWLPQSRRQGGPVTGCRSGRPQTARRSPDSSAPR